MKKTVIFIVLLILITPISFAKEIKVKELFQVEDQVETPSAETGGTTTYFYAGSKLIASKNGNIKYHYQDRMGSDTDSKSLPFGQEIYSGERFSFTGKELDVSDLHYFGARYYDSNLGKFTSKDPVPGQLAYGYVSNNPMNRVDPSGMAGELLETQEFTLPSNHFTFYGIAEAVIASGQDNYGDLNFLGSGCGGSRTCGLAELFARYSENVAGGPSRYELSAGDVVPLPVPAGSSLDLISVAMHVNSQVMSSRASVTTDVGGATTQSIGGPSRSDVAISATMDLLNGERFYQGRSQERLRVELGRLGFSSEEINVAWNQMDGSFANFGWRPVNVKGLDANGNPRFSGGEPYATAIDTMGWVDYMPADTTIVTHGFLGKLGIAKPDTYYTREVPGGPIFRPRMNLRPAPTSADSSAAFFYWNVNQGNLLDGGSD